MFTAGHGWRLFDGQRAGVPSLSGLHKSWPEGERPRASSGILRRNQCPTATVHGLCGSIAELAHDGELLPVVVD